MKKFIAIILALAMLFSITACGGNSYIGIWQNSFNQTYILCKDGTCAFLDIEGGKSNGTYLISDDTITFDVGGFTEDYSFTVEKDKLILKDIATGYGESYQKQGNAPKTACSFDTKTTSFDKAYAQKGGIGLDHPVFEFSSEGTVRIHQDVDERYSDIYAELPYDIKDGVLTIYYDGSSGASYKFEKNDKELILYQYDASADYTFSSGEIWEEIDYESGSSENGKSAESAAESALTQPEEDASTSSNEDILAFDDYFEAIKEYVSSTLGGDPVKNGWVPKGEEWLWVESEDTNFIYWNWSAGGGYGSLKQDKSNPSHIEDVSEYPEYDEDVSEYNDDIYSYSVDDYYEVAKQYVSSALGGDPVENGWVPEGEEFLWIESEDENFIYWNWSAGGGYGSLKQCKSDPWYIEDI